MASRKATRISFYSTFVFITLVLLLGTSIAAYAQQEYCEFDEKRLEEWFNAYAELNGFNEGNIFSVGFVSIQSGEEWYYNGDEWMHPASVYKVPVAMLLAEQEYAGEIEQDTVLANGKTVGMLEYLSLVMSDNESAEEIVFHLGGGVSDKCAPMAMKYADLPEDYYDKRFFTNSYYTARYISQVMQTLAKNPEQFPHVIDFLKEAEPEEYGRFMAEGREKAMKYGAATDSHGKSLNTCSGIIFTEEPVVVTVFLRQVWTFKDVMYDVGSMLADYADFLSGLEDAEQGSLIGHLKRSAKSAVFFKETASEYLIGH